MNKKDAAAFVGISTRQLENYAKAGRLSVRYVKGKTGDVADFDERELRKLRAEREAERAPQPAIVREDPESSEAEPRSLARLSDMRPPDWFLGLLAAAQGAKNRPQVNASEKLTLSPAEAAAFSGLSENFIRGAIKDGKLKAKIIGRAWRIKRPDLDAYIKRL